MNPRDFIHRGQLTENEIHAFILGSLKPKEMVRVRRIIRTSKEDFQTFVSMREAIHLVKSGPVASSRIERQVLGLAKEKSGKSHLQYLIRILKDRVLISSSDQEILNYQGVMTNFAIRGSSPGPISVTRKVEGNEITLSFIPTADEKGYMLEVQLGKPVNYSTVLFVADEEWEVIRDISKKSQFESVLPVNCELEIRFKLQGEAQYTIGVVLSSQS
jgi:hypothetical protein